MHGFGRRFVRQFSGNYGWMKIAVPSVAAMSFQLSLLKKADSTKEASKSLPQPALDDKQRSKMVKAAEPMLAKPEEEAPQRYANVIASDSDFEITEHYYPKVLNAETHPMVTNFLHLSIKRIVERYCHLHPTVDRDVLLKILKQPPSHLRWSGADLFVTTTSSGNRKLTVIETNTCPSGQKSMPRSDIKLQEGFGYKQLIGSTFKPMLKNIPPELYSGALAVVYDKNKMEASGYAHAMADIFRENVYLVEFYNDDKDPPVKFDDDGVMLIRTDPDKWIKVRAAFRYVTQNPWDRIPMRTKTEILNPMIACISGGRNKNLAAKAYGKLNADLKHSGIQLNTPKTFTDVPFQAIPFAISSLGGVGVIKSPYGNAGVDVFTITDDQELEDFMQNFGKEGANMGRGYGDKFIVQSLIGNANWSSDFGSGKFYHVGTVPNSKGNIFVADIRMMIQWDGTKWSPCVVYSRRSKEPLPQELDPSMPSFDILGTNLSVKIGENKWGTDTHRLLVMDTRDFNKLGIGLDDLIDGFVQTVLATIAIDNMAKVFMGEDPSNVGVGVEFGKTSDIEYRNFDFEQFANLNPDKDILADIARCNGYEFDSH